VLRQLEASLRRMGVAFVDAAHVHSLGQYPSVETVLGPGGTLDGLKEARKRGLTKHIGVSGHSQVPWFVPVLDTGEFDLTMVVLNFAHRFSYDFENRVLPVARKHGTAIVAMKVLGGVSGAPTLSRLHGPAIRYALGVPGVAAAVIGLRNANEATAAAAVGKDLRPLDAAEAAMIDAEGRRYAATAPFPWGA
jgi:predicted aldo/keto reductase-like oxidoreductase